MVWVAGAGVAVVTAKSVVICVAGAGLPVVTSGKLVTALAEVLCREGVSATTLVSKPSHRTRLTS